MIDSLGTDEEKSLTTQIALAPEKLITLASLVAPRLGRRDGQSKDEAFAFESRERLRKMLIGKPVTFRVEYKVDSINREFGVVFTESGVNVSVAQVRAGLCKVKAGSDRASNVEELEAVERSAQADGVGLWSKEPSVLAAANRPAVQTVDSETLLSALKMKPTPAVVEFVLNGGTVKLMLTGDGMVNGQVITASIGGIKVPSMGRKGATNEDGSEQGPEPFAKEAKNFVELALMHRDVRIILESLDRRDNFIASILPADVNDASFVNVAEELCRNGLAQVHETSAATLIGGAAKLRAAEKIAKDQRIRLWHNYVPPVSTLNAVDLKTFTAKVIEIISGDCISVAPTTGSANEERRINLSSIRCPKFSHSRDHENAQHEPWAVEARNFLISRLIGQTVEVAMDYTRKIGEGAQGRMLHFATVKLQGKKGDDALNVSEMLLIRGLATAIRHRGEEERASNYDELIAAEMKGLESKKGLHSKNRDAPIHRYNDFSVNAHKAKTFLPFLQRAGKCAATVDYVAAGHKLRVSIPKEGAVVAFCLAGVRCPQRDEPYANQALTFTRTNILQRECEIEVDSIDKSGTFLGTLTLNHGQFNLGEELLRLGLGSLHPAFPVDRVQGGRAMAEIEAAAKETKAGLWKDWKPPVVEIVEEGDSEVSASSSELVEVGVTEVLAGGRFFVQKLTGSKLSFVTEKLNELYDDTDTTRSADGVFEPKIGDMVAAKFTGDDKWSRAIVTAKRVGDKPVPVFYCDFGNEESIEFNRLRPLKDSSVTGGAIPPMANLCAFSFLKVPAIDSDYGYQAATFIGKVIANQAFFARIDARERNPTTKPWDDESSVTFSLALYEKKDSTESVAAKILRAGFARVDKRATRRAPKDYLQSLFEAQDSARRARAGMWEYGDVDSDDE